jgi:hypothetical protein
MASIVLAGNTSGSITISSPSVSGSNTLTLPANTGTVITTGSTFAGTGPAFSAYASTTTTLSANTWTKINYATEDWDTNSNFASSRFTPTVAGYYQINAAFGEGLSTSNMVFYISIYKNGNVVRKMQYITTPTGWYTNVNISAMVSCNGSTDYIEIYAFTGAAYTNNASILNYFDGAMVRSA